MRRGRTIVAVALVVLAAVLAPLSVVAIWVHARVLDTDGYVATVAPLADDPVITDAIATRVVNTLFERADVSGKIISVLPGPVEALGRTLSDAARRFVTGQTERVLASDGFQTLWDEANRLAHEQVVKMFTGKGEALQRDDDRVVLDLGVVADAVRDRLVHRGVGILRGVPIPSGAVQLTLVESDLVPRLQPLFRTLNTLVAVLPLLAVSAIAGSIAVANRRRRVVIALALSIAGTALLLVAALDLSRRRYLSGVAARDLNADAAKAVFDTITSALFGWAWLLVGVAVVVAVVAAVGAFVSGRGAAVEHPGDVTSRAFPGPP